MFYIQLTDPKTDKVAYVTQVYCHTCRISVDKKRARIFNDKDRKWMSTIMSNLQSMNVSLDSVVVKDV